MSKGETMNEPLLGVTIKEFCRRCLRSSSSKK